MAGELSIAAAFVAGVSGSVHCMTMCGGLAGAFGMRARAAGGNARSAFMHAALYQVGRLSSYALAGALSGAFAGLLLQIMDITNITIWLRVLAGGVMMMLGMQLAFGLHLLKPIERLGAHLWRQLSPMTQRLPKKGIGQPLLMGALWGWLPCGLVYSMLLLGALGGSAAHGALLMLAFGVGTLPAMLSSSLLAAQLARITAQPKLRLAAGALMLLFGIWTMWVALQHHAH